MKKKRKKRTIVLVVILVIVLAVSGYYVWKEMYSRAQEVKDFEKIHELVDDENGRNLALLMKQNPECIGWVCIPDTTLDYPVMHTPNQPQKYLRLSFDEKYSFSGVPFLDARCTLESDNLIIYGHNLKNDTMFSSLGGYVQASYSKKHPKIEFETANEDAYYSVAIVAQIDETDEWYNFVDAPNSKSFDESIETLKTKAVYTTDVVPEFGQQLLTLTTCYGSEKSGRLIVVAVKDK
ncbi:MAG: class B sortase [Eubacterium sp.]|nr:class B sortase [Eubacterium sp.]